MSSISKLIGSTVGAVTAVTDSSELLSNYVSRKLREQKITTHIREEQFGIQSFADHAKWKAELPQKYSAEVLTDAKKMLDAFSGNKKK